VSFLSAAYLVDRYGLRLSVEQLGEVLDITPGAVRNQVSAGRFPIPTYLDGGRRWADYRDVAEYLDRLRSTARGEAIRA
jgi:hypothetical protein